MTTRHLLTALHSSCRRAARPLHRVSTGLFSLTLLPALTLIVLVTGCNRAPTLEDVRALQANGHHEDTIEPLRKLLEATPDDPEINYLYGTALSRTGAARVAVWSLRKAAESADWKVPASLELASTQARAENWTAAVEAADVVLELEPENLMAHILRGGAYLSEGAHPDRALEDFDSALELDPTNFTSLTSRASALLVMGRVDDAAKAIDEIEVLVEENSTDEASRAQLCATQAVLRQERGEMEEAEKRFDDCLERFPAYAIVVEPAITFFDAKGDRARSDAILEKALELAPLSISYRRALASRFEAAGDPKRALEVLKEGLKPDRPELNAAIWTDITNYHLERDEIPEAIEAYEQALAGIEDPPQLAILTHADLLARAGRHADARRVAKDLESDSYLALIEARIALDEGNPKRALERLDDVFPVWPNNAGARYYAARAAEQMGDFGRAIEEYRQSIRSAPDQTEAALRLAKLYLAAGSFEDAWSSATQYITAHNDDPEGARVIVASAARDEKATLRALFAQFQGSPLWPAAVATRARFLAAARGPEKTLAWMDELAGTELDWTLPFHAELLRVRVLLLREAGRAPEAEKAIAAALAAHPDSPEFLEIQAALLEANGGEPSAVLVAFDRAITKDAHNWLALEGAARSHERTGDVPGALELYDRATKAHPESPDAARHAAELAFRTGDTADAEKRWTTLLKEHPWNAEAAQSLAELRLARHESDEATLDYAERAVMFGGGKDANGLLVRVHEARGEVERARSVAKAFEEGKPIPPRNPTTAAGQPGPPDAGPTPKKS